MMDHFMHNDGEENKDLSQLYESLNPHKKSLIPLNNDGRKKSQNEKDKKPGAGPYGQLAAIARKDSANGVRIRTQNKTQINGGSGPISSINNGATFEKQFSIKGQKKINIKREVGSA